MRKQTTGYTLIELVIVIFILLLILAISVPSLTGVMADRRLRRSLDDFQRFVHQAQEKSVTENRAFLLVWTDKSIELRPEVLLKEDDPKPVAEFAINRGESFGLELTAALIKDAPAEWIFWPTGACEPATVNFKGRDGAWSARFSPLTGRSEITNYAAR